MRPLRPPLQNPGPLPIPRSNLPVVETDPSPRHLRLRVRPRHDHCGALCARAAAGRAAGNGGARSGCIEAAATPATTKAAAQAPGSSRQLVGMDGGTAKAQCAILRLVGRHPSPHARAPRARVPARLHGRHVRHCCIHYLIIQSALRLRRGSGHAVRV
jgi:hypothetical protein